MPTHVLKHSLREHIADGVMHVLGVIFATAAVTAMIVWSAMALPGGHVAALIPYAVGLLASFGLSAAYNMTLHAKIRAVLRRFDHAAIFLLIAGTYTPMALIGIGGTWGVVLTAVVWAIAALGVVMKLGFFEKGRKLGFILYLAQGWLGVLAAWPMITNLPLAAVILLAVGGVTYTVGTVFYHRDKLPFNRAIWHGHVLAAAAVHYAAVLVVAGMAP